MSKASNSTFELVRSSGVLSERRFQVYEALWLNEQNYVDGLTHNEIAECVSSSYTFPINYRHNIVARLCELESMGAVRRVTERECSLSKHSCTTWETIDNAPNKLEKQPTPAKAHLISLLCSSLEEICFHLEAQSNVPTRWIDWKNNSQGIISMCAKFRKGV